MSNNHEEYETVNNNNNQVRLIQLVRINGSTRPSYADRLLGDKTQKQISKMRMNNAGIKYTCHECLQKVLIKGGATPHFFHPASSNECPLQPDKTKHKKDYRVGERRDHVIAKQTIANYFDNKGLDVRVERQLPGIKRRPDIRIEEMKLAIEIQNSWISPEELKQRTQDMDTGGYKVLWVFITKKSSEDAVSLRDAMYGLIKREQIFLFSKEQLLLCRVENILELNSEYTSFQQETKQRKIRFEEDIQYDDDVSPYVHHKDSIYEVSQALKEIAAKNKSMTTFCDSIHKQINEEDQGKWKPLSEGQIKGLKNTLKFNKFDLLTDD